MAILQLENALSRHFPPAGSPVRVFCEISRGRMPSPPAKVYRERVEVRATPSCKSGACSAVRTNCAPVPAFRDLRLTGHVQTCRDRRFRSKGDIQRPRWCRSERLQGLKNQSSVPFQNGTIARNKRGHENAYHGIGCISCRTCCKRDVRCASRRQTRAAGHEERGHGSGR